MSKSIELLLTENVDNLGIVGDVVRVKAGFARNYLLPFGYAEVPSKDKIQALADKRAQAEKEMKALREKRQGIIGKLAGVEITMVRSCNDQGHLYGSVTQQDISSALVTLGFEVKPREIRLPEAIKRLGQFEVIVKLDRDLEEALGIHVEPDRALEEEREEMEFDNEGNLIEKKRGSAKPAADAAEQADTPEVPAAE
ncbi:MAG: 50S ribosomal protein L9 [Planctomycetota bacterium]